MRIRDAGRTGGSRFDLLGCHERAHSIASHGFLVVAIGPMPAEGQRGGPGGPTKAAMLTDAINWAMAQNSDKSSQYYHRLDTAKIAVAGMSCGGLQALEVAPDTRITTAMICNSGILGDPGRSRLWTFLVQDTFRVAPFLAWAARQGPGRPLALTRWGASGDYRIHVKKPSN